MSKKKHMKALAIALCATTMAGLYATDAHATQLYEERNGLVSTDGLYGGTPIQNLQVDQIDVSELRVGSLQIEGEKVNKDDLLTKNDLENDTTGVLERKISEKIEEKNLATKADVDTAVAGKADKKYVDDAVKNKVGKGYVNKQLATKADKADVDAALNQKADAKGVEKISYNDKKQRTEISGNTVTTGNANVWGSATAKNVKADNDIYAGGDATVKGHLSAASANVSQVAAGTVSANKVTGTNVNADNDIYAGGNATVKGHLSAASANVTDLDVRNLGIVGVGDVGQALFEMNENKLDKDDYIKQNLENKAAIEANQKAIADLTANTVDQAAVDKNTKDIFNTKAQAGENRKNIENLQGSLEAVSNDRIAKDAEHDQAIFELNENKLDKDAYIDQNLKTQDAIADNKTAIEANKTAIAGKADQAVVEQALHEMNENKLDKDDYITQNTETRDAIADNKTAIEANKTAIAGLDAAKADKTAVDENTKDIFNTQIKVGENSKDIESLQGSLEAVSNDRIAKDAEHDQALHELNENKLDKDAYIDQNLKTQAAIESNKNAIAGLDATKADKTAVDKNAKDIFNTQIKVGENSKDIANLQGSLEAVSNDRIAKDAEHDKAISGLEANDSLQDMNIANNATNIQVVGNQANANASGILANTDLINRESLDRTEADSLLNSRVDDLTAESNRRDDALEDGLNTEIDNRLAADAELQAGIANNANAIDKLDTALNTETDNRLAADAELQAGIANNANAIDKLDTALNTEIDNRLAADAELQAGIANNADAIDKLDTALNTEIDNRLAADAELKADITTNANAIDKLDTALGVETDNRVAADNALKGLIDINYGHILENAGAIAENQKDIAVLEDKTTGMTYDEENQTTDFEGSVSAEHLVADGDVNVGRDVIAGGNAEINGTVSAADGAFKVEGDGTVITEGSVAAKGDLWTEKDVIAGGNAEIAGNISSGLYQDENGEWQHKLDIEGATGNITTEGTIDAADGAFKVEGDGTVITEGSVAAKGDLWTEKDVIAGGNAEIAGNISSGLYQDENGEWQHKLDIEGATGNITTEGNIVVNKGEESQVVIDKNGITVGLNSTVMDEKGFYAGGHDMENAKAGMTEDGSLKAANGAFTVDKDGKVDIDKLLSLGELPDVEQAIKDNKAAADAAQASADFANQTNFEQDKVLNRHEVEIQNNKTNNERQDREIQKEIKDREAADKVLQDNIDAEAATRAEADKVLQDNIDAEAATRAEADKVLQDNIDAEAATRAEADKVLQDNIDAEAATREAADKVLQDNIDAEAATRAEADKKLQSNIDAEAATRAEADKVLQNNINAEAATRAEADKVLQNNINAEAATRAEADKVLQSNIDAEAATRAEADTRLDNRITSLDGKVEKVGAGAAALAALHPMDFDPDDKLSFAAGVGNYGSETASALGMFYRPTEKVMLSASGTLGTGENMVNMGLSFALDKKNNVSNTRVALAQEVVELRAQVAKLTAMVQQMAGNSGNELAYTKMFPDIPENHWAYEYIEGLQQRGILDGYPEGYFKGDRTMTRYEFAAMLFRALEKGFVVDEELLNEFRPELGRIRVDRIKGIDTDTSKVERVRVVSDGNRDDYGYEVE